MSIQIVASRNLKSGLDNGSGTTDNEWAMSEIAVSVIMPLDRTGTDSDRAIQSVLNQQTGHAFELILIGTGIPEQADPRVQRIEMDDRNPARRRNEAVRNASGVILAFIDDDAFGEVKWIESAIALMTTDASIVAVGGPDPAPDDSSVPELFSETLLSTPLIGSGILCHEWREGIREVRSPTDLALVNLFVRKRDFEALGGFDEVIGYIGEDTTLLARLLEKGRVVYSDQIVVRHRRRPFPAGYLRQRWRYRVKTGSMMLGSSATYRRNPKILLFLVCCVAFIVLAVVSWRAAALVLLLYAALTLSLAVPRTRLPARWWPTIPFAFALHHATYFVGIITGMVRSLFAGKRS